MLPSVRVYQSLRCVCHTLQLSLKDAAQSLPAFQSLIEKSRKLIAKINTTPHLRKMLSVIQESDCEKQVQQLHDDISSVEEGLGVTRIIEFCLVLPLRPFLWLYLLCYL